MTASILLICSLVWIGLVLATIPASVDSSAGARAFPLWFGVALAVLSVGLLVGSFTGSAGATADGDGAASGRHGSETAIVALTIGSLMGYGFLLEAIGFMPATVLFAVTVMVAILRLRRPLVIIALSLGLAVGCFVVFGKLLGSYLPPGTWITINL